MAQNDSEWLRLTQNDLKWFKWHKFTKNNLQRLKMTKTEIKYKNEKMAQNDSKWLKMT